MPLYIIEISNYWNRKLEKQLHPKQFLKMIYSVPLKSIPPYSPIIITVFENGLTHKFSVKGFYQEDLIKHFNKYGFPIYEMMMDKSLKKIN